eukprot:641153-Rhodomonas_salina.1
MGTFAPRCRARRASGWPTQSANYRQVGRRLRGPARGTQASTTSSRRSLSLSGIMMSRYRDTAAAPS